MAGSPCLLNNACPMTQYPGQCQTTRHAGGFLAATKGEVDAFGWSQANNAQGKWDVRL